LSHQQRNLEKWIAPVCPIEAEWKAVARSVSIEELAGLKQFRRTVEAAGLDRHAACDESSGAAPYSRRAGTLLRFLRARQRKQQKALALFSEFLDWRRDFDVDRKLRDWAVEWAAGKTKRVRLINQYSYIERGDRDREGLTVWICRDTQSDTGGLVREAGEEGVLLWKIALIEDGLAELQDFMLRTGKFLSGWIEVHDVGNYGLVPNYLPRGICALPFYKKHAPIFDRVYPERMRHVFILRGPRSFSLIWNILWPLVPQETRNKMRIKTRATDYLEDLETHVAPDNLPNWLRRDDPSLMKQARPWGGLVPLGAAAALS